MTLDLWTLPLFSNTELTVILGMNEQSLNSMSCAKQPLLCKQHGLLGLFFFFFFCTSAVMDCTILKYKISICATWMFEATCDQIFMGSWYYQLTLNLINKFINNPQSVHCWPFDLPSAIASVAMALDIENIWILYFCPYVCNTHSFSSGNVCWLIF